MGAPFTEGLTLGATWLAWGLWGGMGLALVSAVARLVFADSL